MKTALPILLLASLFTAATASQASAWTRSGSLSTAQGTYSRSVSGSCAGGTCARSATITGPNGRSVSRSGSITRTGPYRYGFSRTTTGPYGRSVTRAGWFRR